MELLFILALMLFLYIGYLIGWKGGELASDARWKERLPRLTQDSLGRSRSVLKGQLSEQLAPFLPGFPYDPSDARFIGKPVDLIVFKGLSQGEVDEIAFIEIKSGDSNLTKTEKQIGEAVSKGKVRFVEHRL